MAHIVITADNFEEEVLKSEQTVLVDFWATWCGPCRMLAPVIEEISEENKDIKVCKIDVDEEPELAAHFGIQSIPTLIVFKNGKPVNKSVGVRPKDDIIAML
jgi:thioredoxin 1